MEQTRYKDNARTKVHYAVKTGKLLRPDFCPRCLLKTKVHAHHLDYSKPLDVIWVCINCHATIHNEIRDNLVKRLKTPLKPKKTKQ